jgi:hypothetical protein
VNDKQQEPFDRAGLAAEIAGEMQAKGAEDLSGVAKYYQVAGLPAKKALEMAAHQAADVMVRYLTEGLISASVEAMEGEGGTGKTYTVGPAKPIRLTLKPWDLYVQYVVRANGTRIADPTIDYEMEVRLEILDAALRRWPDGGYELSLGKGRFGCRVYLKRPGGNVLIADPKTREFSFAELRRWELVPGRGEARLPLRERLCVPVPAAGWRRGGRRGGPGDINLNLPGPAPASHDAGFRPAPALSSPAPSGGAGRWPS